MKTQTEWQPEGRLRRIFVDERGTSLLELALLLPMLLLLVLGIIELGRYAELSILVANAAHAGVQYGAENITTAADTPGIQNAALNDAASASVLSPPIVSLLCSCGPSAGAPSACPSVPPPASMCSSPGYAVTYVQVQTSGTFTPLVSYAGINLPTTVTSTALMRVAN